MSSRALRRLERQKAIESPEIDSSDEVHSLASQPKAKANAFALLNEDEDGEPEDEEDKGVTIEPTNSKQNSSNAAPSVSKASKKKKGKKSKKAKASRASIDKEQLEDEDLDNFLAEVKKRDQAQLPEKDEQTLNMVDYETIFEDKKASSLAYADANFLWFTTSRLRESLHLLSVGSVKNLDPDTELQNLFGKLSVNVIEDANSTTSLAASPEVLAQYKRLARLTRGWGGKDHRGVPGTSRKLLLTRIRDDWLPTTQKLILMEDMTTSDAMMCKAYKEENDSEDILEVLKLKVENEENVGIKYFRFKKLDNIRERVANSRFFASVVMTPDPESLMQLLQQSPYHVETLLQVSMVMLREGNNKATSNALIEKSMFVFDRSFSKNFHELLQSGKTELIRLPYESFANRQFYLTLFRVISGLGERSTFYTALNFCKFLLALSPAEDPLGVRYFLDHYAILSENFTYLTEFVNSSLTQTYSQWFTPGLAFSNVLALLHLKKMDEAKTALKKAFSAHPMCAYELLKSVGLSGQLPLKPSFIHNDSHVQLASETYLVRAPMLWKEQNHRQYLHDELTALFEMSSTQDTGSWFRKLFGGNKNETSLEIPVNLIRFVVLSGENKVLAKMPEKIFERDDMLEYDVIPPKDERKSFIEGESKVTDSMFDYLDHNIIGAIVQNRTAAQFEDFLGLDEAAVGHDGNQD